MARYKTTTFVGRGLYNSYISLNMVIIRTIPATKDAFLQRNPLVIPLPAVLVPAVFYLTL